MAITMKNKSLLVSVMLVLCGASLRVSGAGSADNGWQHAVQLDANYDVFWSVNDQEATFEVHAATLGYIIFGISNNGQFQDSDLVVGWVQNGRPRFQDRHGLPNGESLLDPQQDYDLINGYENETHTVMRFRRKLFTCDDKDVNITAATTWLMYAYASEDPLSDLDVSFMNNRHGARPTYLIHKSQHQHLGPSTAANLPADLRTWELRNVEVAIPETEDTLYWCRIFKLPPLDRKHHMIRYEPVFTPGNKPFIHHMNVYECDGDTSMFEELAATVGTRCYQPSMPPLFFNCNNVVVAWTASSDGFTFPPEAGYPMNRVGGARFFMLETHYDNPNLQSGIVDNSGLRLFYTSQLRHHDAGVLSVGIDPNWKHIVPPGQRQVISEAHCVADCTQQALPSRGINVFAVNVHTHLLGRQVKLRHVRGDKELPSLVNDPNYNVDYQEYRQFQKPINVLPGDHLISQCTYNSESRSTITLGGLSTREETCLAYLLYWPRVDLSLCYSLPSLGTILHSLGIEELLPGSDPVRIKSPPELSDQTVEERLITLDWEKNFNSFQDATRRGAFRPLCWVKTQALIDGSAAPDYYPPNVTQSAAMEQPMCAPRGTLLPRMPNMKNPHRKTLSGSSSGGSGSSSGGYGSGYGGGYGGGFGASSYSGNRNRGNSRATPTTAPTASPVTSPTTSTTTEESLAAAAVPSYRDRDQTELGGIGWAISGGGGGGGGGAPVETPQNDILSADDATSVESAAGSVGSVGSEELSSRSGGSTPCASAVLFIALIALLSCIAPHTS